MHMPDMASILDRLLKDHGRAPVPKNPHAMNRGLINHPFLPLENFILEFSKPSAQNVPHFRRITLKGLLSRYAQ